MKLIRRDPAAAALRSARRRAWTDVQRGRDNSGDEANARWYAADAALREQRASGRNRAAMNAAAAGLVLSLFAFVSCVFASTCFAWHPALTGPGAGVFAIAMVAFAVWLNRTAGDDGDEEPSPERES